MSLVQGRDTYLSYPARATSPICKPIRSAQAFTAMQQRIEREYHLLYTR